MTKRFFILVLALLAVNAARADDIKQGLSNESNLGVVVTTGNSQTSTVSFGQQNTYVHEKDVFKFAGSYLDSSTNGNQSAMQWSIGPRYERELNKEFNVFVAETIMGDHFQGIEQRYATDVGGKYYFDKNEAMNWFMELGYRFTRENYPYGFANLNFARLYTEAERTFHKGFSAKLWVEYLPNITRWKGYQLNSEASVMFAMNDIFSLKTAYQLRYYNEPPAGILHTTDTTFTTSLVAKF